MADAFLLEMLKNLGKGGSIDNVVLFGRVRCAIKQPAVVGSSLEFDDGFCAIIDCYAIKCLGMDYFTTGDSWDINQLYTTKGSMLIFLDDAKWIGKDVKVYGKNRGVNVRQQFGRSSYNDGITAFSFVKTGKGFRVVPNRVVPLTTTDSDIRGTSVENLVVGTLGSDNIKYSDTIDSLLPYEGSCEYEELTVNSIDKSTSYIVEEGKIDLSEIKLDLVHHLDSIEESFMSEPVREEIGSKSLARRRYARLLVGSIGDYYEDECREDYDPCNMGYGGSPESYMYSMDVAYDIRGRFINNIAGSNVGSIGKRKPMSFVHDLIDCMDNNMFSSASAISEGLSNEKTREALEMLRSEVVANPSILWGRTGELYDKLPVLSNDVLFAVAVVGVTTGISVDDLLVNYGYCAKNFYMDINVWFYALIHYPYALGLLGSTLSLVNCDELFLSYYKVYGQGILREENLNLRRDLLFLENLSHADDSNSFVSLKRFKRMENKYPKMGTKYLSSFGFPAPMDYILALETMLGSIRLSNKGVSNVLGERFYSDERKQELEERGIINELADDKDEVFLIMERDLEKEYMIYTTLRGKGTEKTGITEEEVQGTIREFEAEKGFSLEPLQKDGCMLCMKKAGVLSGCAGSGKTTTSDCMTEILKLLDDYKIVYCAPTGKACRRLAEVVHGSVRTIHSQFGVGMSGGSYLSSVSAINKKSESGEEDNHKGTIYLLDEMAMVSIDLLYEVVRNLQEEDLIYLLGDIKQLPPIGRGYPFATLMKMLPCVELGVSKRAVEGSEINYNTTLINNMSDNVLQELYYDGSSFVKMECSDVDIPMVCKNAWKGYMSGEFNGTKYSEDDIQIITAYQKQDISFSSPNINPVIQELLRGSDRLLFYYGEKKFYENERVIHTTSNNYDMCRYIEVSKGVFKQVVTCGIVNGELGKIAGVHRSDIVTIEPLIESDVLDGEDIYSELPKDTREELVEKFRSREETLRDDTKIRSDRDYFVKVEVYDVELCRNVYVFYRARAVSAVGELVLSGGDLSYLDLAYSLTTHKMQGSQSPVVILLFGSSCYSGFVNRNMINTMVTRARESVCCVGSVYGADSAINRGRREVSSYKSNDLLNLLITFV